MDSKYDVRDDFVTLNDAVKGILIETEENQRNCCGANGFSTGFPTLDALTNGLQPWYQSL